MPTTKAPKISKTVGDLGYLYDWKGQLWPILKVTSTHVFTDSPWFRDGAGTEANWRMLELKLGGNGELSDGRNLPYDPRCLPLARTIQWPEALDGFGPYLINDPLRRHVVQTTIDQFSEPRRVLGVSDTATVDEIHAAFRRKAREHHPDAGGDPEIFRQLVEARNTLLA
ncbi:MAG: DnaJ domain-containing protein [Pseudomonadota bacterium]